jgi:hypothetical protein
MHLQACNHAAASEVAGKLHTGAALISVDSLTNVDNAIVDGKESVNTTLADDQVLRQTNRSLCLRAACCAARRDPGRGCAGRAGQAARACAPAAEGAAVCPRAPPWIPHSASDARRRRGGLGGSAANNRPRRDAGAAAVRRTTLLSRVSYFARALLRRRRCPRQSARRLSR